MAWHDEYMQANRSAAVSFQDRSQPKKHWTPPVDGFLKLNVDGSFLPSIPYGGTGGVIRDSHGQFIAGFSCRMEFVSSPLHIELLSLKNGLELLQAMQITRAIVEVTPYLRCRLLLNSWGPLPFECLDHRPPVSISCKYGS
ncbi:uncharacterized protein LOC133731439 [Rosa rugosa]|uniref:uncharacterized protein LOC133731439 n=1 Tax=Rosa rugosa TaxID=74645 RepID=UPI002B4010D0|nr:uncharacterized protein LOC133731439 [Rosa rugosa]